MGMTCGGDVAQGPGCCSPQRACTQMRLPHCGAPYADGHLPLAGALVGPPWSQRELGVVLRENLPASAGGRGASLYYEPHAGG